MPNPEGNPADRSRTEQEKNKPRHPNWEGREITENHKSDRTFSATISNEVLPSLCIYSQFFCITPHDTTQATCFDKLSRNSMYEYPGSSRLECQMIENRKYPKAACPLQMVIGLDEWELQETSPLESRSPTPTTKTKEGPKPPEQKRSHPKYRQPNLSTQTIPGKRRGGGIARRSLKGEGSTDEQSRASRIPN